MLLFILLVKSLMEVGIFAELKFLIRGLVLERTTVSFYKLIYVILEILLWLDLMSGLNIIILV